MFTKLSRVLPMRSLVGLRGGGMYLLDEGNLGKNHTIVIVITNARCKLRQTFEGTKNFFLKKITMEAIFRFMRVGGRVWRWRLKDTNARAQYSFQIQRQIEFRLFFILDIEPGAKVKLHFHKILNGMVKIWSILRTRLFHEFLCSLLFLKKVLLIKKK